MNKQIIGEPTCGPNCGGLNYEAEYERLRAENEKLREELREECREIEILRAKLSIVHLIFGGSDNG